MTIGEAPATLVIHNAFKQKAEKEQEQATPTQTLAELTDRINGRRYDAGMKLTAGVSVKTGITADTFKAFDVAGNVYVKEAGIDAKAIRASHDDHIRQIVREEIRQFVNRESRCGGLFSRR
ncbi:hypothetical protein [Xenorhabdus bovienii]|uniref:hypothetical protein n=1 Tax=Xenorhabdus bovienii TaxID=40576 RepID=UPI0012D34B0E|nr:hypothetical protein [Xenorhabdus bovienii]